MKSSSGWWERLLKDKARQHWLRVDFQNWKDEDDVGDEKCSFEEVHLNFIPFTNDIGTRKAAMIQHFFTCHECVANEHRGSFWHQQC